MWFFILLFSLNLYADEGLDISGLIGAEVIVDPYGDSDYDNYWHTEDEIVAFSYDNKPENTVNVYEGNACIEKDGCYGGNGIGNVIKLYGDKPLIFRPFTFDDIFD